MYILDKWISILGLFMALRASNKATEVWVNAAGLIISPSKDFSADCMWLIISPSLLDWKKIISNFFSIPFFSQSDLILSKLSLP